jgi:hypothetical protein
MLGADCTTARYEHGDTCRWCPLQATCELESTQSICPDCSNRSISISYEYDCPLGPDPYPGPPEFLPNWMGAFVAAGAFHSVTLMDLSLPGTHDSVTYDLSLTVSEAGLDKFHELEALLHKLSKNSVKLLPGDLENFFRMQAKTQQLTLTQQLDNGIRFLDLRIMRESDKTAGNSSHWYSIHFMQSRKTVANYLHEIRNWVDLHPHEVVVLWLSQHGNPSTTGDDQFPGVTSEEKEIFWQSYLEILDGVLLDRRESSIFETPVVELIKRQHRVITFASDYQQLTRSSPYALDARNIQNRYDGGDGVFDAAVVLKKHDDYFQDAEKNNADATKNFGFTLLGMNTAVSSWQTIHVAAKLFLHSTLYPCASHIHIPGVSHWCPETLLDIAQLASYYNQISIDKALNEKFAFPNAFYLDALDFDGTIRTGSLLLDGANRGTSAFNTSKFAYVYTIIEYNRQRTCSVETDPAGVDSTIRDSPVFSVSNGCTVLASEIEKRRQKNPLQLWDEPMHGRHRGWPATK